MEQPDIEKLADLCRLSLTDKEKSAFAGDIATILAYVSAIQDLGSSPDNADSTATEEPVLRDDGEPHTTGEWTDRLVQAFSGREGDHAKVKKILSHE